MEFPGFVGGAYSAANPRQDDQRLINWYVEYDRTEGAKTPVSLLGAPGLVALCTAYQGEVRGSWTLPGGKSGVFVVGGYAVLATIQTAATATSRPVFNFTRIGQLATSTGPVRMRDNGAARVLAMVDGANLYTYKTDTGVFAQVSDAAFLGSNVIAEIDGWFFFAKPGSQTFYSSPLYWNGTDPFDGTYYALKDNSTDNLVALIENNRELWLIGEATTEPWFNAGNATFPMSRLQGALLQVGCAAAQSVARTGQGLIWLGTSERGGRSVVVTQGYQYDSVSTPAINYQIAQYPVIDDAIGYVYTEEGHEFYVLTFPTADVTWVYDLTTKEWAQRASKDPVGGLLHRQRANCCTSIAGMHLVGDYANGRIYWQTRTSYVDDQYPLVCIRRAPHVWDHKDRNRVSNFRIQIEFNPGSAPQNGQGSQPEAMLRWSNDSGQTWGNEVWRSIGLSGETRNRAIWRRLGAARDRVYELTFSDPVCRDVVGASIQAEATGA